MNKNKMGVWKMSKKLTEKENWRQTRENLARQINELLFEKRLSIVNVAEQTGIPLQVMESLTLGREVYRPGVLRQLAAFLDKKVKIELVD